MKRKKKEYLRKKTKIFPRHLKPHYYIMEYLDRFEKEKVRQKHEKFTFYSPVELPPWLLEKRLKRLEELVQRMAKIPKHNFQMTESFKKLLNEYKSLKEEQKRRYRIDLYLKKINQRSEIEKELEENSFHMTNNEFHLAIESDPVLYALDKETFQFQKNLYFGKKKIGNDEEVEEFISQFEDFDETEEAEVDNEEEDLDNKNCNEDYEEGNDDPFDVDLDKI